MASESHVYIVQLANEQRLKIGKADVVINRMKKLGLLEDFDPTLSWQVRCPTKEVKKFEDMLHFRFSEHRRPGQPGTDGYTEWFDTDCYNELMPFVRLFATAKAYAIAPLTTLKSVPRVRPPHRPPDARPDRMFLSLQPLRPWIEVSQQFPHALSYAADEDGDLHIYLDAQGQDAQDIIACFAGMDTGGCPDIIFDRTGIDFPFMRYRAGAPAACRVTFGSSKLYSKSLENESPRLRAEFEISAGRLRHYTRRHPGLRRIRNWFLQQIERPEIRRVTLRPAGTDSLLRLSRLE